MTPPSNVESASAPTANAPPREQFIPLRKADLVEMLAGDGRLGNEDRRCLNELSRILEATFHFEYHARLETLKNAYAPFDPDSDTVPAAPLSPERRQVLSQTLFDEFISLLQRANFRKLARQDVEDALTAASDWGVNLDVDFDVFERLELFARGATVDRRERRRAWNFWRSEEIEVPIYRRLVVILQLRDHRRLDGNVDTDAVYIKIFKNIPQMDLEMLLPGTRVRMTLWDQGRIWLPTLSGIVMALVKVAKGALMLAFAGLYGLLTFLGLVGGTIGYGIKSFFGYLRTKDKYQLNLTRSLYFQNLDNNAGVLCRLLDEAEEQELREALLGYFLLWREAPAAGWTEAELDDAAEAYLRERTGIDVDFEVDDALAKLVRLGLAEATTANRYRAIPIDAALERLDHAWDNFFTYNNQADAAQRKAA